MPLGAPKPRSSGADCDRLESEHLPLVAVDPGRIVLGTWFLFLGKLADGQHARQPDLLRDAQHLADRLLTLRSRVATQPNRPQPEPGRSDEDVLRRRAAVLQPPVRDGRIATRDDRQGSVAERPAIGGRSRYDPAIGTEEDACRFHFACGPVFGANYSAHRERVRQQPEELALQESSHDALEAGAVGLLVGAGRGEFLLDLMTPPSVPV
jgi:hypothetical protein